MHFLHNRISLINVNFRPLSDYLLKPKCSPGIQNQFLRWQLSSRPLEERPRSVARYFAKGTSTPANVRRPKLFSILSSSVEVTFKTTMMEACWHKKDLASAFGKRTCAPAPEV